MSRQQLRRSQARFARGDVLWEPSEEEPDPYEPPTNTVLYFRRDLGGLVYVNSDGTNESGDNDPVGYYDNAWGANPTQDTSADKPIYRVGHFQNGDGVEFDGSSDHLDTGITSIGTSMPEWAVFMGLDWQAESDFEVPFGLRSANDDFWRPFYKTSDDQMRYAFEGISNSNFGSYQSGVQRWAVWYDGSGVQCFRDGNLMYDIGAPDPIGFDGPIYLGAEHHESEGADQSTKAYITGATIVIGSLTQQEFDDHDAEIADILGQS